MLLLLGLTAGSWWLAASQRGAPPSAAAVLAAQPGYYLVDATVEQSDANGQPTLSAHAARATQLDPGGDIGLEAPTLHYRPEPARDWIMTATTGRLPARSSQVQLDGAVILRSAGAGPGAGAVVHTDHLQLDVATHVASTSEPVRIELAPHVLAARGLRADLSHDTLQLESAVHGTFTH
jgi:LPS export ABC transporter protein LptC